LAEDLWDVLPGYLICRAVPTNRTPTRPTVHGLVDDVIMPGLARQRR
jgi:hypothetical protein